MHLITIHDHHKTSLRSWSKPFKSLDFHIFSMQKRWFFKLFWSWCRCKNHQKNLCFWNICLCKTLLFYKLFEASSKKLHHWGGAPLRSGLAIKFWIAVTYYIVRGWRRLQLFEITFSKLTGFFETTTVSKEDFTAFDPFLFY